jgi:PAS domain S-box-containing protein
LVKKYLLSFLSVAAAFAVTFFLNRVISQPLPFPFFFLVVILNAWFGGFKPALFAIILSLVFTFYSYTTGAYSPGNLQVIAFFCVSLLTSFLIEVRRKSEHKLKTILASIADGVVIADSKGRIQYMNKVAEDLTLCSAKEAKGKLIKDVMKLYSEDTKKEIQDPVEKVMEGGVIAEQGSHTYLTRHDGSKIPLDDSVAPILDESNRVQGVVMVFRDISARKKAELELAEREARFRNMADQAPVLIWMAGKDKLRNYFNRPWLEFTGRSLDEESGKGWIEDLHPEDLEHSLDTYHSSFDARAPFIIEYRLKRSDKEFRWLVDYGVPLYDASGAFTGYIGSCIDISERKILEEKIQSSLKEKELLLREVHHRVKNNLQIMSSLLNLQSRGTMDFEAKKPFQDTVARIKTMALVHEMLYRSSDLAEIDFSAYIRALVEDILKVGRDESTAISVTFETDECLLDINKCIPLGLIVNEIVANSLKHAFTGRDKAQLYVGLNCSDFVTLTIGDDGAGISGNPSENTFGLRLVQILCKQLNATLETNYDNGLLYSIRFPRSSSVSAPQTGKERATSSGMQLKK